jgi:hypothetical protein
LNKEKNLAKHEKVFADIMVKKECAADSTTTQKQTTSGQTSQERTPDEWRRHSQNNARL